MAATQAVFDGQRIYQCDQCGHRGRWGESWAWFGSHNLMDFDPGSVPHLCSWECQDEFQKRIDSGDVKIPEVVGRYPKLRVKGRPVGYPRPVPEEGNDG